MIKRFTKSLLVYGIASGLSKFIGVFLVPIYARVFSQTEYGIIDLITTIVSLASIFGMLQIESGLARYYYDYEKKGELPTLISTTLWSIILFSFLSIIIVVILSGDLSRLISNSFEYQGIIILAAFQILFGNIFALFTVIIRFQKKSIQYTVLVTAQLILTVGISIILVLVLKIGIYGVFIGQMSGFAIVGIFMINFNKRLIYFKWSLTIFKELIHYSIPLVFATGTSWINNYGNRFVMLNYLSVSEIGVYTVALKISSIFLLLDQAFRMAWTPYLFEIIDKPNHREIIKKVVFYLTIFLIISIIIISGFAGYIVKIVVTNKYILASSIIPFICTAFSINILTQIVNIGPAIRKKTWYNTGIYFLGALVNILSLYYLIPRYNLLGVVFSSILGATVTLAAALIVSYKIYDMHYFDLQKL